MNRQAPQRCVGWLSVTRKIDQMLFLAAGLVITGHAVLTPMLMVVLI